MTTENANLYDLLARRFPAPDTPCIETADGRTLDYGEVQAGAARFAAVLADCGARPGDRIAVQVPKSPAALMLYLGALRAGLVYLPLNTGYTRRELDYFIADAEPSVVVSGAGGSELAEAAREKGVTQRFELDANGDGSLAAAAATMPPAFETVKRTRDDLAAILYTSGTTGLPKGAMLSHGNLAANAFTLVDAWGFNASDVLLHALPLFHTHGLFVACHCVLASGARMILLPRFDAAEVLARLPRATVMMGVPTFYTRLLALPSFGREQCAGMRLFISGSAPMLTSTHEEFAARTGHTILERYGMTETGMNTSNPLEGERRPGTVGPPLPGVQVRITGDDGTPLPSGQVGGIELKGPNVFSGYWRNPEKTAAEFTADGWFRSGDLGRVDEDGYVSIVGRGKDLVISGGFNVYPKEVEMCIDRLPGVVESAVIGVPDADFGEAVTAVVVTNDAENPPDETGIISALKRELAGYKVPKHVHIVDELPRNTMGKVQKNVLRQRYAHTT